MVRAGRTIGPIISWLSLGPIDWIGLYCPIAAESTERGGGKTRNRTSRPKRLATLVGRAGYARPWPGGEIGGYLGNDEAGDLSVRASAGSKTRAEHRPPPAKSGPPLT